MNARPTIAVIGAGAVGGYYGGRLALHGHDVHLLMRSNAAHVREHGLKVRSVAGDFQLPPGRIHVYDDPNRMPQADLVMVTLKSTQNAQLARLVPASMLKDDTTILTLQNGLGNEEELAKLFGKRRIVGGIAFVCINRVAPGVLEHDYPGFIRFGEFGGSPRSVRLLAIADMFNASGVEAQIVDDLRAARWAKLVWNIPFNGLGALLDCTTDRLIRTERGVRLVTAVMREVIAAARANGVVLPDDMPQQQIEATRKMGAYRTSTQADRQTGVRSSWKRSSGGRCASRSRRNRHAQPRIALSCPVAAVGTFPAPHARPARLDAGESRSIFEQFPARAAAVWLPRRRRERHSPSSDRLDARLCFHAYDVRSVVSFAVARPAGSPGSVVGGFRRAGDERRGAGAGPALQPARRAGGRRDERAGFFPS
jgi:2-dehydropantoate 2-reductase